MLLKHKLVNLTLSVFTLSQLPIPGLDMGVQFVSLFLDDNLSLEKFRVIMQEGAFESSPLELHGIQLLLA
jgi:hypothetical protein